MQRGRRINIGFSLGRGYKLLFFSMKRARGGFINGLCGVYYGVMLCGRADGILFFFSSIFFYCSFFYLPVK